MSLNESFQPVELNFNLDNSFNYFPMGITVPAYNTHCRVA